MRRALSISRTFEPSRDLVQEVKTVYGTTDKAQFDYTYDALDRRATATDSGEIIGDYGAAVGIQYGYDGFSQLTSAAYSVGGTAMPGRQFGYAYDAGGNRTSVNHTGNPTFAEAFTANTSNEITARENTVLPVQGTAVSNANVVVQGGPGKPVRAGRAGNYWGTEVALDNSNAPAQGTVSIQAALPGGGSGGTDLVTSAITRTLFQGAFTESLSYDADGNLTGAGEWTYTWDAENRLTRMETSAAAQGIGLPDTVVQFTYDYLGRRVKKSVTVNGTLQTVRLYVYYGWNLAAELNGDDTVARNFFWGLDLSGTTGGAGGIGGLLMFQDGSSTCFPAYDGSGNVMALLDASGTTAAIYEYSPFGALLRCESSYAAQNPFRFSTRFFDTETGLYYYGHRYYSPDLGRFINRDPIEEKGGPNLYGFVGNDPANSLDMLGLKMAWLEALTHYLLGIPKGFVGMLQDLFNSIAADGSASNNSGGMASGGSGSGSGGEGGGGLVAGAGANPEGAVRYQGYNGARSPTREVWHNQGPQGPAWYAENPPTYFSSTGDGFSNLALPAGARDPSWDALSAQQQVAYEMQGEAGAAAASANSPQALARAVYNDLGRHHLMGAAEGANILMLLATSALNPEEDAGALPDLLEEAATSTTTDAAESDAALLQGHLDSAIARFNVEGYTDAQAEALINNPELSGAFRGSQIDSFFKESVLNDPALSHLEVTPQFQFGPDVFNPSTQEWWDVTTPGQWTAHTQKYWLFGNGTPLFTQ